MWPQEETTRNWGNQGRTRKEARQRSEFRTSVSPYGALQSMDYTIECDLVELRLLYLPSPVVGHHPQWMAGGERGSMSSPPGVALLEVASVSWGQSSGEGLRCESLAADTRVVGGPALQLVRAGCQEHLLQAGVPLLSGHLLVQCVCWTVEIRMFMAATFYCALTTSQVLF